MKTRIAEKFQTLFLTEGEFFASAGRINLIGEHTEHDEYLQRIPFFFELSALIFENLVQTVSHFFSDVVRDFFHIAKAL